MSLYRSTTREWFSTLGDKTAYASGSAAFVLLLIILTLIIQPSLLDPHNWPEFMALASVDIMVAMAQVPALMVGNGGVDLSVGPLAGLVGVVIAAYLVPAGVSSGWIIIAVAVLMGLASGVLLGSVIAYVRVPAVIVTLGAYLAYNGLAINLLPSPGGVVPSWLIGWSRAYSGIPEMIFVIAAVGVVWLLLQHTAFRRNLLAAGGERRAAYSAGVPWAPVVITAFAVSGAISGVAGLMFLSVLQSAVPSSLESYTLLSLAGAALGGVSLFGGRGGMFGAACGGAILFLVDNLLSVAGVSAFYVEVIEGIILIVAIGLNLAVERRRRARTREKHVGSVVS